MGAKKVIISFLVVFSLVLSFTACIFASEIIADSRIAEVTVYSDSALISRIASLKLNPGEYKVIFPSIIPEIDENSLRVSGDGSAEFKLFGAQVKREFLEELPQEKVRQLQDEIQKLEDEKRKLEDNKRILSEEKQFLDSIRLFSQEQIPKDLATKVPAAKELDDTLKFLSTRLQENYAQVMDIELKLRELQKKIDALRSDLSQIAGPIKKLKRLILVELEVQKPGSLDLIVSYLARGATWHPIYDARASFDKSQIELVSFGIVRQTTGEEWPDTELYLSTAKPAIGGRMPYISPWFLKPYQPSVSRNAQLRSGRGDAEQFEAFTQEDTIGAGALATPAEVAYAAVEEKGTAVIYKLPRKASVKSDGSEHKLPISSQFLQAKFEYSTHPRLAPFAYLGSRVINAKDLQLLAGKVNIFLEGDFVGSSSIDNIGPGEEFDLYLGVDENVKVKREQIEKKIDDVLIANIPAPNRRTTLKYKTTIEDYKNKKIKVIFFEAMPVSEDERIKVKIVNVSLEPKEKDWKDRKGVWLWELELEPKAKKEIAYTYTIEHPRDMQVEGL